LSLTAIREILKVLKQEKLLSLIEPLPSNLQERILKDLQAIDFRVFEDQRALLKLKEHPKVPLEPVRSFEFSQNRSDLIEKGLGSIEQGKVACLVVAGGQGTRLGSQAPKGCFPVSAVRQKSLFQLIAEKTVAAGVRAGRLLSLVIMTSPENRQETEAYFKNNAFFGLAPDQLHFIQQDTLPFLTANGDLFFSEKGKLAQGPDGNGSSLQVLSKSGVLDQLKKQGVEFLNYILVDNPLADPFDPLLVGYHAEKKADVTLKCIQRTDPAEKVGLIVQAEGKICVKEYSEIAAGEVLEEFTLANISLFCFSLAFAERTSTVKLPLHAAFKSSSRVLEDGTVIQGDAPSIWKFEKFIFDLLAFSRNTALLVYPREECFAPLKQLSDLPIIQKRMTHQDREKMRALIGKEYESKEIERSYYYLTHDMQMKLKAFPPKDEAYLPGFLEIKNFLQ
jgi:UDP-N-acetylglucosamine/UDP-N-acetylgalactosamine diphosphorylase